MLYIEINIKQVMIWMNVKNLEECLFNRLNLIFIAFLALFIILGSYLLHFYQYDLINKDIISMISVARLYATGNLSDAINGYWGPLFSWFLVPSILINSSPTSVLFSTKVISLIFGFFTLIGVRLLSYRIKMSEKIRISILFAMVFVILYFALIYSPVDLILTCFLVYYLYLIFDPNYYKNWYNGALCGILCGLAYLTKSYIFPFFIIHFLLFNSFHYFKNIKNKKSIMKNLLVGLALFMIISGAWSAIISDKYNKITFGTSGTYNYDVVGPTSVGHPTEYIYEGFIKPPYANVTSAWEDPTYLKVTSWNPFQSKSNFIYQINKLEYNIQILISIFELFSYLSLIILLASVILSLKSFKKLIADVNILYPLITILIFSAGYLLILLEARYLWIVFILLMLMGGYLLELIFKRIKLTNLGETVLIIVFIVSFLITPFSGLISFHYVGSDGGYVGKDIYDMSQTVESQYPVNGNIASNGNEENGAYRSTLHMSYFLGTNYYGFSKYNESDSDLKADLTKYGINYYFVWGNSTNNALLSQYKEVSNGKIPNLRIYKINTG